jgi:hypothetical protein
VAAFTIACSGFSRNACVPQPSPGNPVSAISDRLMFRLAYRNFGTHEALVLNHTIQANGTVSGIRWYEIRNPNGSPAIFQQGTYGPNDGLWRWMGSLAQDQAQDLVLGYSLSSSTTRPSIAWAGRVPGDPAGTLGQAEAVIATGAGIETGSGANRWGDYSAMTIDPVDDCTFWFTTELYNINGGATWDTRIASVKFPTCAANDFSLGVAPSSQSGTTCGGQLNYTVTTGLTKGAAETIALNVQDLPAGVTASFNPASVTAGASSTLTLTITAGAPVTASPVTFTVVGTAPSALHPATAQISIATGGPPPAVGDTLKQTHPASNLTFNWTDLPAATSYAVYQDTAPGGAFSTLTGSASSGAAGLTVPLPAGSWYFAVGGVNGCGAGPLH